MSRLVRKHGAHRISGSYNSGRAGVGVAVDIETACHAANRINWRKRIEAKQKEKQKKITLPTSLDEWLKKPIIP